MTVKQNLATIVRDISMGEAMTLPADINDRIASTVRSVLEGYAKFAAETEQSPPVFESKSVLGGSITLLDRRSVRRDVIWMEIPLDERSVISGTRDLLRRVIGYGGLGRYWFTGPPIHLIADAGIIAFAGPDDWPVCRLRSLFYAERLAQ